MKYIYRTYAFIFILLLSATQLMAQKGKLFIIGGGTRSPELIQSLLETSAMQQKDYIIVLPMATAEPEASFNAIKKQITAFSKNNIAALNFTPEQVNNKNWLDSLKGARLIYIAGGDQSRFMKAVLHTPVYAAIHEAYQNGATIAGTSAGAAVMSKQMITGTQLQDSVYKETFNKLWTGNIEFEEGMGLLDGVIIDQHFLKRSRYNRLISALAAYPKYECIGIDEGTAIIVQQKKVTVAGASQVLRISKPKNLKVTSKNLIKLDGLEFNLYTAGDQFLLKKQ
ncbi:cyanophycinase [Pedobacter sp. MR2016-24]|uniref:cyanophycinase n=1 Tax=Pedobacter sp. MR2016-24 TaxID=2994466 RepID=UPI0022469506|nr:cyanophycinase [Pedobacter sp. MR2016-24]MCX2484724.1 cyanophycinase [Pedobacter sp. MR2016-24]